MNKIVKTVFIVVVSAIGLVLLYAIIIVLSLHSMGIENAGVVKYDDCRQIVTIKESENGKWNAYFRKPFVCDYKKSKNGFIMGGTCVLVNLDSSGACVSAYVYQKQQDPTQCVGAIKDGVSYPYLGYDDNCHTTPQ